MSKKVIYQVLPRIFGNTTEHCKPNGTIEENGVGKFSDFTPQRLSDIASLGVTHIWYTGVIEHATTTPYTQYGIPQDNKYVVKGLAGSPYAIKDYYSIDPDLADNPANRDEEFQQLIERTHEQGMKVIIDFIPNHVARSYKSLNAPDGVKSLGEEDDTSLSFSANNNFYYIPNSIFNPLFYIGEGEERYIETPAKVTGNDAFTPSPSQTDWYETVKLNYGINYQTGERHFNPIPNTWFKMLDILKYWSSKGVDAFRCDMAEMVPFEFWRWAIGTLKAEYPEVIFIAEVYNPEQYHNYAIEGGFDYLYDKVGLYDVLRNIINNYESANAITRCWQSVEFIKDKMLHFTENHDEQRSASPYFAHTPQRAFSLFALSTLIDRNPIMLYSGQELGEVAEDAEGFSGADGRTTIFDYWSVSTLRRLINRGVRGLTLEQKRVRIKYKTLLNIATKYKSISEGEFFDLMYVNQNEQTFDPHTSYLFARKHQDEIAIIAVNFTEKEREFAVNLPQHLFELWELPEGDYRVTDLLSGERAIREISPTNKLDIKILPCDATILILNKKNHKQRK